MIIYINKKVQTDDILKIETNLVTKKYHAYYYCPLKNTELKNGEECKYGKGCGTQYYIINYVMKDGAIIEEKFNYGKDIISRISKILNCDNELDELNTKIDRITYELDIDGPSKLDIINDKIDKFIDNNNNNNNKVNDIASDINTIISALNINPYRNNYIDQIITSLDDINDRFDAVNTKLQEVQEGNEQTMGILMNLPPSCGPNYIEASTHFHNNF